MFLCPHHCAPSNLEGQTDFSDKDHWCSPKTGMNIYLPLGHFSVLCLSVARAGEVLFPCSLNLSPSPSSPQGPAYVCHCLGVVLMPVLGASYDSSVGFCFCFKCCGYLCYTSQVCHMSRTFSCLITNSPKE